MVVTFADAPNNAFNAPRKIAHFKVPTRIYIQVFGAPTIFLAHEEQTLTQAASGGQQGGLQVVTADKIKEFTWWGDLFASASAIGAQFDIEMMEPFNVH